MLGNINIRGTRLSVGPVFQQGSQLRILKFLWGSRDEWSGREIAREVGLSAPACHEALKRLNARGLVTFRNIGHIHLYKVVEDNYLNRNIFAKLFEAEKSLPDDVAKLITKSLANGTKTEILSIVLFGSIARGKGRLDSDMDLLVVTATKEDLKSLQPALDNLGELLIRQFGMALSPYAQSLADFRHKHAQHLPLIKEILKDGQCLYGKEPKELLS